MRKTINLYVKVGTHVFLPINVALTASFAMRVALFFINEGTLSISSWTPLAV